MEPSTRFTVTHDTLVQNWNKDGFQDYELKFTEGECGYCLGESIKILTQIGAERFGVKTGFCLGCVTIIKDAPFLKLAVGFKDSSDEHFIKIDSEKIENFLNDSKNQALLSEKEIADLTEVVKANKANPKLAKSREYKEKPCQCKQCLGYILKVNAFSNLCNLRDKSNYLVSCFGCSLFLGRERGCSILTCEDKLCANQFCAFCLDGASTISDLVHDIAVCSKKILEKVDPPKPRLCNCSN